VEEIPEYVNMLSYLFVAVYMLSVPLETTRGEIIKTLGHLNLMGRVLLANFVFIPILGILAFSSLMIPMNMVFSLVTGRMLREPTNTARPVAA